MEAYYIRIGDLVTECGRGSLGVVINTVDPTPKYNHGHALVAFMNDIIKWYRWEDLQIISRNPKVHEVEED
mgnify:CR=1 FL=1